MLFGAHTVLFDGFSLKDEEIWLVVDDLHMMRSLACGARGGIETMLNERGQHHAD